MPEIRLHLRILVQPDVGVKALIDSCRAVFRQAKVSIRIRSRETLNLSEADRHKFAPVRVFNFCRGNSLTAEQEDLFALAPGIDSRDVVVFLVQSTDKALEGCAQHPANRPGAIVTSVCTEWTLAHELGHLLGLSHVAPKSRLMYNGGTIGVTADPPVLVQSEINHIIGNSHNLLH